MTTGGDAFDDVLAANSHYSKGFTLSGLEPVAARGLAIVSCSDCRPVTPRSFATQARA